MVVFGLSVTWCLVHGCVWSFCDLVFGLFVVAVCAWSLLFLGDYVLEVHSVACGLAHAVLCVRSFLRLLLGACCGLCLVLPVAGLCFVYAVACV